MKTFLGVWAVIGVTLLWFHPWIGVVMLALLGLVLWLLYRIAESAYMQDG
jgi:hypothetical protein